MTKTTFLTNAKVEDVDYVILDSGDIVRRFKSQLSTQKEAHEIFEHVLCQVCEYIADINEATVLIQEFCTECTDIIYGDSSDDEGRNQMHLYIDEFSTSLLNLIVSMNLIIDQSFIYSFIKLIGDDIVLGYVPQLHIEPTQLQLRNLS